MRKQSVKTDLKALHRCCELNYVRLQQLLPAKTDETIELLLEEPEYHQVRVSLKVVERSVFTEVIRFTRVGEGGPWLPSLEMTLRVYHDAHMLEVIEWQGQRVPLFRLQYPNRFMYQEDEKLQSNLFFGECLDQCLAHGQSVVSLPL